EHPEVVQLLLEHGADSSVKNNRGQTVLHWAALLDHREVALLLVTGGADVSAETNAGETPLGYA
ncbi:ankyrin repeat-containing domain protein, partial [Baffinella frigidus]